MKKILFFAAMALTLVGCTEDYKDWTVQKPDTTPDAAIDVKATIEMASALDFNTYTEGTFQLFTPSVTSSVTADSIRCRLYQSGWYPFGFSLRAYNSQFDIESVILRRPSEV